MAMRYRNYFEDGYDGGSKKKGDPRRNITAEKVLHQFVPAAGSTALYLVVRAESVRRYSFILHGVKTVNVIRFSIGVNLHGSLSALFGRNTLSSVIEGSSVVRN